MKKFVAQQPILDPQQKVFAYELLFRSGLDNFFDANDPDQASTSVIGDSLLLMGMETLTGGDRAFINCTRNVLIKGYAALLPKDQVVVEILESVEPGDELATDPADLLALERLAPTAIEQSVISTGSFTPSAQGGKSSRSSRNIRRHSTP